MNISKYKCAIVQYACDDCRIGDNHVIKFDFNKSINFYAEKGHCSHIDLLFFEYFDSTFIFSFFVEFQCKLCGKKLSESLINKDSKDEMAILHYKCECGEGNLNVGILFQKDVLDNSNNKEKKDINKEENDEEKNTGNKEKKIENFISNKNDLIVFNKKDKTLFNKFYNYISLLLNDQKKSLELLNEHIIPEIDYENYYLLNEDWFNKIIKIYEPENKYSDNKETIDSIEKVTNVTNTKITINEFNERIKIILDEYVFKTVDGDLSIKTNRIIYPKNFTLVKENILNDILIKLKISNNNFKKYLYPVKFGENHIFIKNNKEESGETIYVCFLNENKLQVGIILVYNEKNYFDKEIEKFISNRGGLEYYYQERKLKVNLISPQKIIHKESDEVGYLINIINLENYINPYKFKKIEDIFIEKEGNNIFKMSSFEKLKLNKSTLNSNTYLYYFYNMNYGNNPMNQINMPDQHFIY